MQTTVSDPKNNRQRLIRAGIEEIAEVGFEHFSTRNAAKRCGLSYNAPYKHFKNTDEYIKEIFGYVNSVFLKQQERILNEYRDASEKTRLVEVSMLYIRFLTENPDFLKVILHNYADWKSDYRCLRGELSFATDALVAKYCEKVGMLPELRQKKLFAVRSFIYNAAFFFNNGQMEINEANLSMVRSLIEREFALTDI